MNSLVEAVSALVMARLTGLKKHYLNQRKESLAETLLKSQFEEVDVNMIDGSETLTILTKGGYLYHQSRYLAPLLPPVNPSLTSFKYLSCRSNCYDGDVYR